MYLLIQITKQAEKISVTIIDDLIFSVCFPAFLLLSVANDFPDFYDNETENRKKVDGFYVTPPTLAPREQKIVHFPHQKAHKVRSRVRFKTLASIIHIENESRSSRPLRNLPDVC